MNETMARLYELQTVDSALAQRKQWIVELDDGRKTGAKLAQAKASLQETEEKLKQLEATNRARELELKSTEEDRAARSKKAYGGTVSDGKELASLERKIEELTRRRDHLEDEILGLMEQIEATRVDLEKQKKTAKTIRAVYEQTRQDYTESRGKFEEEMKGLLAKRQELISQIDQAILAEYDELRTKLEGVAVAGVEGNMCKSCRTILPQSTLSALKLGKMIVKCQNCRRILFPSEAW